MKNLLLPIFLIFSCGNAQASNYDVMGDMSRHYVVKEDFFNSLTTTGNIGQYGWTLGANGAGAVVSNGTANGVANRPGIISLATGTTATGRTAIHLGLDSIILSGGMNAVFAFSLPVLSTALEEYVFRIGFGDNISGDFTDGAYFEYARTVSANWQYCTASNGVRTKTASSAVVNTGWNYFKIQVNPNASSVEFFLNGVNIGTLSTNIPTASGRTVGPHIHIIKSVGTTSRQADIDYYSFYGTPNTPR